MSAETTAKNSGPPHIVTSDKAFRLAEQWVDNMSKAADDEPVKEETESRPLRLGLGAKVSRQTKPGTFSDPIARKLYSSLEAGKRKAAIEDESSILNSHAVDDADSEDDLESRASAFTKKRVAPPPAASLPTSKKKK